MMTTEPPGIRVADVSRWLTANVAGANGPFAFQAVAGGRSNLTYIVSGADSARFVLRRPPLGHLLPSAHDMAREYRIISGLHGSAVPVAAPLGFCDDESVSDRPFYVMEFVDGLVLRSPSEGAALTQAARRHCGESLVDTLIALHRLDLGAVGLADLGKHDGYMGRQLKRWRASWDASSEAMATLVSTAQLRSALELIAQPVHICSRQDVSGNRPQLRKALRGVDHSFVLHHRFQP